MNILFLLFMVEESTFNETEDKIGLKFGESAKINQYFDIKNSIETCLIVVSAYCKIEYLLKIEQINEFHVIFDVIPLIKKFIEANLKISD